MVSNRAKSICIYIDWYGRFDDDVEYYEPNYQSITQSLTIKC